jgi:hypothetical protein
MKKKSKRCKSGELDLATLPPPPSLPPPVSCSAVPKPEDVPGLFVFKWCDDQRDWYADCDEPLRSSYFRLANRDLGIINLAQSLALIGLYKLENLRILQQWVSERKRTAKSLPLVSSENVGNYWFMVEHCVELACALHEAFRDDLSSLYRAFFQSESLPTSDTIRARMDSQFANTLLYAIPGPRLPQGKGRPMEMITVNPDGQKKKIPLAQRAIQVAVGLANTLRRSPTMKELKQKIQELHQETQHSQRVNVSAINWSSIFKQAGLGKLPNSRSGKANQPLHVG